MSLVLEIAIGIFILFFSVVLHECAHGWAAYKLGDDTAKSLGRLTLNPIKHVDPIGTLLIPGILLTLRFLGHNIFLFGWAKPVPVNFNNLRNPRRDMIWVALAGPAVNIAIAITCSLLLKIVQFEGIQLVLATAILINLMLAVFNLIPIPPLDGSRILVGILPPGIGKYIVALEPFGLIIVFTFVYLGLFSSIIYPIIHSLGSILGINF